MTEKRFGMYQNILYDDRNILNPFDAMKLLNHFDKENTKLKEENEQLKKDIEYYKIERAALFEYIDKKDDLKLELKVEK